MNDVVTDGVAQVGGAVRRSRLAGKALRRAPVVLVGSLVAGGLADIAVHQQRPGVATCLLAFAMAAAVAVAGVRRRSAVVALVAAVAFVPWLAVRTSVWLNGPNLLATASLLLFAADLAAGGVVRRSFVGFARVVGSAVTSAVETPVVLGRLVRRRPARPDAVPWGGLGRAAIITAPVMIALLVLLRSGDALFASALSWDASVPRRIVNHAFVIGLFGFAFLALAVMATPPSRAADRPVRALLRPLDVRILLGGVCALFAAYATVQLSALVAGADYVKRHTGLTYAAYARSGFFQLMAAAAVSFAVLCLAKPAVRATPARAPRVLVAAVVVLTEFLVVGSIVRIRLYVQVFGLSHLRLYTIVSAAWIGAVVLVVGVASVRRARPGADRDWVAVTACGLAALVVWGMNVVNPDALVAERNIGRALSSVVQFDDEYLGELSTDAIPAIVAGFDRIPAANRPALRSRLCAQEIWFDLWDANLSAARARDALAVFCARP